MFATWMWHSMHFRAKIHNRKDPVGTTSARNDQRFIFGTLTGSWTVTAMCATTFVDLAASELPLPGLPGSDEFMSAYKAALAGEDAPAAEPKVRGEPGTFSRLAAQYFVSPDFLRLRTRTQHVYRLVIDRFLAEHGHRRVAEMRRDDVKKIMALKAATPGSANDLLKKIRTLIKFAIDTGWRTDDPTLRIKTFPEHEFHTWTEDEIAQYEERLAHRLARTDGFRATPLHGPAPRRRCTYGVDGRGGKRHQRRAG